MKRLDSINRQEVTHGAGYGQAQSHCVPTSLLMAALPCHPWDVLELLGQKQGGKIEDFTK